MTNAIEAHGLSKRYGRHPALTDAELTIPTGRIVGLVGPNGAGKSTLLGLVCGLLTPTAGTISVLGARPPQLARVGFVAQDTPVYAGLTVADHLRLGAKLNPHWDAGLAERRIRQVGLDPARKAGRLSGGQRAQLALTLAAAKRAELLVFDEPVAALDPLARRQFLQSLLDFVEELAITVVLSSHLISDLEHACDHLVVLAGSRVRVDGGVDELLRTHRRVRADVLPESAEVVHAEHGSMIVRGRELPPGEPVSLEEMVLAYLSRSGAEVAA